MSIRISESFRTREEFHQQITVAKGNRKTVNKKKMKVQVSSNGISCLIKTYLIDLEQLLHYPCFIFWWFLSANLLIKKHCRKLLLKNYSLIKKNKAPTLIFISKLKFALGEFPGSPAVKTLPSKAGHFSLVPGQGTRIPHATGQLSPCPVTKMQPSCN